jgi:tetratricopeptide (TPR) repeat protein
MILLGLASACTRSAADHEELGDRAYAAGAYRDALAEYQLGVTAGPTADLLAKCGAAALHTQDYALAAREYSALAEKDRSRAAEAAEGIERVVRAALAANDRAALASALAALQAVAPGRPLGRYARLVVGDATARGDTAAALALLPVAVAAAPDGRSADSLLLVYGMAAARARDCQTAVPVMEGVIRRQRESSVVDGAREGLSMCALFEGQALLDQGKPGDAESWFKRATAPGASLDVTRTAYLGLGDVRLAQGDVASALESYQQAMAGGNPGDSITIRAQQKMNALGKADPDASPPKQL